MRCVAACGEVEDEETKMEEDGLQITRSHAHRDNCKLSGRGNFSKSRSLPHTYLYTMDNLAGSRFPGVKVRCNCPCGKMVAPCTRYRHLKNLSRNNSPTHNSAPNLTVDIPLPSDSVSDTNQGEEMDLDLDDKGNDEIGYRDPDPSSRGEEIIPHGDMLGV